MITINFAVSHRRIPNVMSKKQWLFRVIVCVTTILVIGTFPNLLLIKNYNTKLEMQKRKVAELDASYMNLKSELSLMTIPVLSPERPSTSDKTVMSIYQRLQDIMPQHAWLDRFSISSGNGAQLAFSLVSRDTEAVDTFNEKLTLPIFAGSQKLELVSITVASIDHRPGGWFKWNITAKLKKNSSTEQSSLAQKSKQSRSSHQNLEVAL